MKNLNEIFFVLHARTQSVRVPNKMLRPFAGSCLFEIAVKKFLSCKNIQKENLYLSVLDERLREIGNKHNVKIWNRSEKSTEEPVTPMEVYDWHKMALDNGFKYFLFMNPCSCLLPVKTIDDFIQQFSNSNHDGLFAVLQKKNFVWAERTDELGEKQYVMLNRFLGDDKYKGTLETKLTEPTFEPANCLYAGKIENIMKGTPLGSFTKPNDPDFFIVDPLEAFDIDDPWQFELAEQLYLKKQSSIIGE